MSEKAERLASARKKLREHQSKNKPEDATTQKSIPISTTLQNEDNQNINNNKRNIQIEGLMEKTELITSKQASIASKLQNENFNLTQTETPNNVIQVLITEKAALTSEITKCKNLCKDRDLEIEEIQARHNTVNKRMNVLEKEYLGQQKKDEELTTLLNKMGKLNNVKDKTIGEQNDYIVELKNMLSKEKQRNCELDQNLKEKINELELNKVRFNQISDEVSLNSDNRIETLIQTKFMYEQQIRDLQAMVQQFGADKEQANLQYQNYVQHLKNEVTSLSEKNNQLCEENSNINKREKDLIHHISNLEKQIQQTIASQEEYRIRETSSDGEVIKLQMQIEKLEEKQLEFQLKIKSQEDELLQLKDIKNQNLKICEELERLQETCLDSSLDGNKLLATIESDKIAASRALLQNEELKRQLEELQKKFVQLTNDKLELHDRLDSEKHANREIKVKFKTIEKELMDLNQKLHFKDEEMIRLSHENNELIKENKSYEILLSKTSKNEYPQETDEKNIYKSDQIEHTKIEAYNNHNHNDCVVVAPNNVKDQQKDFLHADGFKKEINDSFNNNIEAKPPLNIEATEKLQIRFTQLIREVADLTDEKQRLEHLVLQLQGETETIGEYIALYQTQRRMLKQREYEKASQFQKLMQERKELKENLLKLNSLVLHLGIDKESVEGKSKIEGKKNFQSTIIVDETKTGNLDSIMQQSSELRDMESKDIIKKIQNIILEIKENTKDMPMPHTVDHCSCCLGKLETI